ncbi:hypothetical protein JCM1841_003251 [Sporobolomyces salmonicolor]
MAPGLLPLYVAVDTLRSLLIYAVLHSGIQLSPTALTSASEFIKLFVAVVGVLFSTRGSFAERFLLPPPVKDADSRFAHAKNYLQFAVPASLYFMNNLAFLYGLEVTTPALLSVSILSKLPLTALLHHFVVRRRNNQAMWTSLVVLSCGLVLAGCPEALWDPSQRGTIRLQDIILGPLIGLGIGCVSACSSVWTELMLKADVPFWTSQLHLYAWGSLLSGITAVAANSSVRQTASETLHSLPAFLLVSTVTACTGLLVAAILKKKDNLVKLVGASLCITTVFVLQHLLYPLTEGVGFRTVFGIGVLTVATWCFNFYKDVDQGAATSGGGVYLELAVSDDGESGLDARGKTEGGEPAPAEMGLSLPDSFYKPTPTRLAIAGAFVVLLASLATLVPTSERSIKRDIKEYFGPRGVTPADWAKPNEDPSCLFNTFGNYIDRNSSLLADWNNGIASSGCPIYPIPDAGLITHLFWSGRWRPTSHGLTTDAWLATQRLGAGNQLIWWYEGDGPDEAFLERYTSPTSPYRKYVSFRKFEDSLAEGTCLTNMREWADKEYQQEIHFPVSTRSDLIRLLLLSKYGGIWLDADSVPLRDFTPLIRSGPAVPTDGGTINNNVLIYGPTWSGVGQRVLELACQMPYNVTTVKERFPDFQMWEPSYWLYNAGVSRLCRTRDCGLGHIPIAWVDMMYWSPSGVAPCEAHAYDPNKPLPATVHGPFAYHSRMTKHSDGDPCYNAESGTLISAIKKRIETRLATVPLTIGGDLFPGPGYNSKA